MNIAIDGPAGSGKSTVAKRLAKELSFIYVDTGAMYRAMALYCIRHDADPKDEEAVCALVDEINIEIRYEQDGQHVLLNGEDVSGLIRNEEVGGMASTISAYGFVRDTLTELQRDLARTANVIMDGRDIGTCILPNADVKIFLTASVECRATRRYKEMLERGVEADYDEIAKDIAKRDEQDMNRAVAPLKQAEDAVLVDTSDMNIDEVVAAIRKIYQEKCECK